MITNGYIPWLNTDSSGRPVDKKAEVFGRAYAYILGSEWGKGTPLPWREKKSKKNKKKVSVK